MTADGVTIIHPYLSDHTSCHPCSGQRFRRIYGFVDTGFPRSPSGTISGYDRTPKSGLRPQVVQKNIEYTKDASGKGMNEYRKYPYETLCDMRVDCEDSAILYASVMKSLEYEVALILYDDH